MITTDATRISYAYVRIMPNNVEHKLIHIHQLAPGKDAVVAQTDFA